MDPPNVLWFFGAFAIEFAVYALIQTIPDNKRGLWIFVVALGFLVGFAAASWLLLRRWWWVPGGLAAARRFGSTHSASSASPPGSSTSRSIPVETLSAGGFRC